MSNLYTSRLAGRDPRCVLVTDSVEQATSAARFLADEHGIPTLVINPRIDPKAGHAAALRGVWAPGTEVWAADSETAMQLREWFKNEVESRPVPRRSDTVLAFCDECGRATKFPSEFRDRVDDCPHCGSYIDVADSDIVESTELDVDDYVYQSPIDFRIRRFKMMFAAMCVVGYGAIAVLWIVSWAARMAGN